MLALSVVVLSGCALFRPGDDAPGSTDAAQSRADPTEWTPSPNDLADPGSPAKARTITGVFGSDAIEGGCAYLETDDGTRYEVLYPEGWTVKRGPFRLLDPDGGVVAQGGARVTVRGRVTTDMASICQIGPIFSADEVVDIEG